MKFVKRFYKYLMASLLAAFGFASCDFPKMYGPPRVEYGTPHAMLKVDIKLEDADSQPIGNAELLLKEGGRVVYEVGLKTDEKGVIEKTYHIGPIKFEDTWLVYYEGENPKYMGVFKDDSVKVQGTQIEEGKGWNRGTYELKATLKLKKKD